MSFLKSVKDTYKKYRLDLDVGIGKPILTDTDAEFLPRDGKILMRESFNCDDLCHETAHALEHIYGKIGKIETHIYGGISTGMGMTEKTLDRQSAEEFKTATDIDNGDESFKTYANHSSERFARFITLYLKNPKETKHKYPNISKKIEQQYKEVKTI